MTGAQRKVTLTSQNRSLQLRGLLDTRHFFFVKRASEAQIGANLIRDFSCN
jgi:hypothetical protein